MHQIIPVKLQTLGNAHAIQSVIERETGNTTRRYVLRTAKFNSADLIQYIY